VNMLNKQSRTADKEWYSIVVVGRGTNNSSTLRTLDVLKIFKTPRTGTDPFVLGKECKKKERFGTWNVRSL
jgi:hypothetical protein